MREQIKQARDAGYDDAEIAAHLFSTNPKISEAVSAGYSLDEVADFLDSQKPDKATSQDVPEEALNAANAIRNQMVSVNKEAAGNTLTPDVYDMSAMLNADFDPEEQMQKLSQPGRIQELMDNPESTDPSLTRIAAGIGTEIVVGESAKVAGTAAGAAIGAAGGPLAPITVPAGAGVGYVVGAIGGGYSGSIAAQKIEGKEKISHGRAAVSSILNLLPAGAGKGSKLPTVIKSAATTTAKHRVKAGVAVGAVGGPAYTVADTLEREDRMPTMGELAAAGVTSATLGAALGWSSRKVEQSFAKLGGKSKDQINDMVLRGDENAISLINSITELASDPSFKSYSTMRGYLQELGDYAKANVAPSLRVGPKATEAIITAGNISSAGEQVGGLLNRRISQIIAKSEAPEEVAESAMEYLVGRRSSLPTELKNLADDLSFARKEIRQYQQQLIKNHENGQRLLPEETYNTILKSLNEGNYLTQSYRFFSDVDYKPTKDQTDALFHRLTRIGLTDEQIDARIAKYVANYKPSRAVVESLRRKHNIKPGSSGKKNEEYQAALKAASKPTDLQVQKFREKLGKERMKPKDANAYIAALNTKRAGSPAEIESFLTGGARSGILKHKEALSPELRDFLGEYTTPGEKIASTMAKISRLAAYDTADFQITQALMASGQLVPATSAKARGLIEIKLKTGNAKYFDGKQTHKLVGPESLQIALNKLYSEFDNNKSLDIAQNIVSDFYQAGIAASKIAKVPLNPSSYPVNLYGNLHTMIGMGMNPTVGLRKGIRLALADMSSTPLGKAKGISKYSENMPIGTLEDFSEALKLGVVGKSVVAQDMMPRVPTHKITEAFSRLAAPFGKAYAGFDTIVRTIVQENHVKLLQEIAPNAPLERIKKSASIMTNDNYQNYDRVNKALKTASRHGVIPQFATFYLEFARNQFNQVRTAKQMITGEYAQKLSSELGVPVNAEKLRNEGIKRIAALGALYAGYEYGFNQFNRKTVSSEEEKALRETVLPGYNKNSKNLITLSDDGSISYANASYIVPHLLFAAPVTNAMAADTKEEAATAFASSLIENLQGEGSFFARSLISAISNVDVGKGGRQISGEISGSIEYAEDVIGFFAKDLMETGVQREFQRAKFAPMEQTLQRMGGLRIQETTIEEGFSYKAGEIRNSYRNEMSKMSSVKRKLQDEKATFEEYQTAVVEGNRTLKRNHDVMVQHVQNLIGPLQQPEDSVIRMLKDSGFSSEDILGFLDNQFTPKDPNKPKSTGEIFEENYSNMDAGEIAKELRELGKLNPSLAKRIADHYKSVEKDRRTGVTGRAALMRSLSPDKRARRVFDEMQQSSDPDSVLKRYIEMGVVNKETYQAIDLLRKTQ